MRTIPSLAVILATTIAAAAFAQDVPVIKSCSRLSGKEKAACEWENHKAYKELAKQNTIQEPETSQPETVVEPQLPSCSRKSGQEKAKCEWENHKAWKASLIGGDEGTASSAAASAPSAKPAKARALGVPALCRPLKGKERAKCIVKERKKRR